VGSRYALIKLESVGRILVIGSSNTDMVVKSDKFPSPGETLLGGEFFMFPGGKGANQAVAAARLGGEVSFISKVGDDMFGLQAIKGFEKEGIDTTGVLIDKDHPSGVALITVNANGENQIVVASGANAQLSKSDIDQLENSIMQSELILVQLEIPLDTVEYVISKAKQLGKKIVLNPAPGLALSDEAMKDLYCITPNQSEAKLLTGIDVDEQTSARSAASSLLNKGVTHVIITLGSQGSFYMSKEESFMVEAKKVEVQDTTAAGDVYNGALCVGLESGKGWRESIEFATIASSIAVSRMGAQSSAPHLHEL